METSGGEAVYDQGSGCFEVKKKHRSSSKFSLQSWVGGLSGKNYSNFQHSQPSLNERSRNLDWKSRSQQPKAGGSFGIHVQGSVGTSTALLNEDKQGGNYLGICVAKQDSECSKLPPLFDTKSDGGNGDMQKIMPKDKLNVVQKIKCVDPEGEALVLHSENNAGTEIKFGDIQPDNLVAFRKHDSNHDSVSCNTSCVNLQENQLTTKPVNVECFFDKANFLTCKNEIIEENCKVANKESSEDMGVVIAEDKITGPSDDASKSRERDTEDTKPVNNDIISYCSPSSEDTATAVQPQHPVFWSKVGEPKPSQVAVADEGSSAAVTVQDTESDAPEQSGNENSGEPSLNASVVECCSSLNATFNDDMSNAQSMNPLGEDDSSESKERFRQRLWCFLFENLNRSVDELYLLCELECDLEQMKEAILVLEEAASDFKDLTTRVEEFEHVKKCSSHSIDGAPITLKTDHRRPHALSWEIRLEE